MIIEKSQDGFRVSVPCKVNLFLEVLGKRSDGYHSLDTVMMAVSLMDELELIHRKDDQLEIFIQFPEDFGQPIDCEDFAWRIPADHNNLVVRALDRLRNALGKPDAGATVKLTKRIPAMAGLGGGSADAAAALILGLLKWGEEEDFDKILTIAAELGSDINFFLEGRINGYSDGFWLARCTDRGENIQPLHCNKPLHFVLVHPPRGCNTREVFESLNSKSYTVDPKNPDELLRSLTEGGVSSIAAGLFNRLENPAMQTNSWVDASRRWIDRYDHHGQCMTGSGSARFCLCATREQAEKIVSELQTSGGMRAYYARSWQSSGVEDQVKRIRKES